MASWQAEWVDERGAGRSQELEAEDRAGAASALPEAARLGLRRLVPAPDAEAAAAARELARALAGGAPLTEALRAAAAGAAGALRQDLERAAARATEGAGLAQALGGGESPLASEPLLTGLLAVGAGGPPSRALRQAAGLLARREEVRARARSALVYPALTGSLLPLVGALVLCTAGAGAAQLAAVQELASPGAFLGAARAAASHPERTWGLALLLALGAGALPLALSGWIARSGELARGGALLALGRLVRAGLPAPEAWALACPGAAPPPALVEGAPWARALAEAGLLTPAEATVLEALGRAGPAAQGAELEALGQLRLCRFERRGRRLSAALELALLLLSGTGMAFLGGQLLGGGLLQ